MRAAALPPRRSPSVLDLAAQPSRLNESTQQIAHPNLQMRVCRGRGPRTRGRSLGCAHAHRVAEANRPSKTLLISATSTATNVSETGLPLRFRRRLSVEVGDAHSAAPDRVAEANRPSKIAAPVSEAFVEVEVALIAGPRRGGHARLAAASVIPKQR